VVKSGCYEYVTIFGKYEGSQMDRLFLVGKSIHLLAKVSVLTFLSLVLIACGETPDEEVGVITADSKSAAGILFSNDLITRASWSDRRSRLRVSGDALRDDVQVEVYAETVSDQHTFIGSAQVQSDRSWEFDFYPNDTSKVPCAVYVKSEGAYESSSVSNSPSDCGLAYVNVDTGVNQAPNGNINTPSGSRNINVGQALSFDASGSDPDGDSIVYLWDFGNSGVAKSTNQTPGTLIFNKAGTFPVSLTVTDSKGLADPTPSLISVTVNSLGPLGDTAPNGTILSPVGSTVDVFKGKTLNFQASATDPDGDTNLNYSWNFGDYRPGLSGQNVTVKFDTVATVTVKLNVRDSSGKLDPTADTVTVRVLNESINSEPNGTITTPSGNRSIKIGESINFAGTASDPQGDPLVYLWDFGASGIARSTSQNPGNKVFSKAGVFDVRLTVTDDKGLSDSTPDTVRVTVSAASNSAPNGNINSPSGSRTINVGQALSFDGSASDPDGDSVVYLWNFGNSGITNSTKKTPGTLVFNKAGTYPITFTVTDSKGLADPTPASINITVKSTADNAPNGTIQSPAGASVDVFKGRSLTFKATATDPDGDTNLNYSWNFGSYRPGMSGQNVTVTFDTVATVTVKLFVRDSTGKLDPTADTITVRVLNQSINSEPNGTITQPVASRSINIGDAINFAGTASDPEGDPLVYLWDFGTSGISRSTSQNPGSKVFSKAGIFDVSLTVTDDKGLSDSTPDVVRVTVASSNTAPNGRIDTPTNRSITVGESLFFSGTGIDADGDTMVYLWDFGTSGVLKSTKEDPGAIVFNKAGSFRVTFTVTDENGLADPSPGNILVTVADAVNNAPDGSILTTPTNLSINVGDAINFAGNGTDPDGDAVVYLWEFGSSQIPNSTKKLPGLITFNQAGSYVVRLTVTDATGLSDPTPATVTVNVGATSTGSPNGFIVSPIVSSITVPAGGSLTLTGDATDPDGDTQLSYVWDFGAYGPKKIGQTTSMTFDEPGVVTVKLLVKDSTNLYDPTPAALTVSVLSITQTNQPPESTIRVPSTNQSIAQGEAVFFSGLATDPENNTPLRYFWNFDGAVPNSTMQNPGSIVFNNPGVYRVTLSGTDNMGVTDTTPAVRIITVDGESVSPPNSIINSPAGDMVIDVGSSVRFSGSATDLDNDTPYRYLWNFDGVTPNQQVASPGDITFTNAGVYNISLRVTDATGVKDPTPATVQIVVTNIDSQNEPPNSVIITPSMDVVIYEGDSLTFRGTGTDPEGDSLVYLWDFGSAAPNSTANNPGNIQFTQAGIYNISFAATDSSGLTDPTPDTVRVIVKSAPSSVAPNGVITSPATGMRINEGDVVNFNGFGTDADGNTPLSYLWNFDGAAPHVIGADPGNVVFSMPGTYRVRFSVTDATGLTDPTPAERIIIVDSLNQTTGNSAPIGVIDSPIADTVVFVGQAINFTSSGIDPDGDLPLTYRWNFGGAVPNSSAQDPGLVTFTKVGTYRIVLTVTDSLGVSDSSPAERLVTVVGNVTQNQAPNAIIVTPDINQDVPVNGVVSFEGAGTDPDNNTPLTYLWDFDGAVPNVVGRNPGNVTFKKAGNYTVTLKVVDSQGAVDPTPAQVTINVSEGGGNNGGTGVGANWPILNLTSGVLILNVGESYTFEGAVVGQNGEMASFAYWNFNGYTLNALGSSVTKTFDRAGTVTVDYRVKDASGAWVQLTDSVTITVQ